MHLKILRRSALKQLREDIGENVDVYENGEVAGPAIQDSSEYVLKIGVKINENVADLISLPDKEDKRDKENCISIYGAFKSLTPRQASDERVWTYLTHFIFWDYARARWPMPVRKKSGKESEEDFFARKVQHIKLHYFANRARGLTQDNAVSRLWWMGRIAERCRYFDLDRTLDILLKQSNVRVYLLRYSALSMSEEIFSAIILALDKYGFDKKSNNGLGLFDKQIFREFMKQLNLISGTRMLNSLPEKSLRRLIKDVYVTAKSSPPSESTA